MYEMSDIVNGFRTKFVIVNQDCRYFGLAVCFDKIF